MDPTGDTPASPGRPAPRQGPSEPGHAAEVASGPSSASSSSGAPIGSEVLRQLDALDARLRRIEKSLGYLSPVRPSQAVRGVALHPESSATHDALSEPSPATLEAAAAPAAPSVPAHRLPSRLSPTPPPPAPLPGRAPPRGTPPARNLEQLFGERVIAWVGAIIVVIGAALFVKLAYDQKWFTLAPWMRCVAGGAFGAALVCAGEFLRRRVSPLAGAGALAAGIGTMYASAFAAYELYEILGLSATYALLAAISALGIVLAVLSRLVSVGFVGMLGGYLVPILLWSQTRDTLLLPGHLLIIHVGACVLASRLEGRFHALRALSMVATFFLGTLWTISQKDQPLTAPLVYLGLTWLLVHIDLLLIARRSQREDPPPLKARAGALALARKLPIAISLSFTAWAVVLGIFIVRATAPEADWLVPCVLAIAALIGACAEVRTPIPATPATSIRARLLSARANLAPVAIVLLAECGALILLTLGITFDGPARALSIAGIALAAGVVAKAIRARNLVIYASFASLLAAADLTLYHAAFGTIHTNGSTHLGLVFTTWTWCMWTVAAVMLAIGRLSTGPARKLAHTMSGLGLGVLCLSFIHDDVTGTSLAWAWLFIAALAAFAMPLVGRLIAIAAPPVIASLSTSIWAWPYLDGAGSGTVHTRPVLHGLVLGLAIASLFALIGRRGTLDQPRETPRRVLGVACWVASSLIFLMATSFEIARVAALLSGDEQARAAAVSIWWAVCGVLTIVLGFARSLANLRRAGLVLLYAAGFKIMILDFATISAGGRVVAFIGVGILMLLVGVVYARLSKRLSPMLPLPPEPPSHEHVS